MFHIGVFHTRCFINWVGEADRELTFVTSTYNGSGQIYYGTSTQQSNELSGILEFREYDFWWNYGSKASLILALFLFYIS